MPPTSNLSKELGVDSPITKKSRGSRPPFGIHKMAFDLQNMLFEYKSGFSITKIQLSITKMASQFTKWPLGLQVTLVRYRTLQSS